MKKLFILFVIILSFTEVIAQQSFFLIRNGKSSHSIWLSNSKSKDIQDAARIFNNLFEIISGTKLTYRNTDQMTKTNISFIIRNKNENPVLTNEGFIIETKGDNILFSAQTGIGLEYAVYTFLEKYMDCRYYAHDAIIIPQKTNLEINPFYEVSNPAFSFRVIYYYEAFQKDYIQWNKLNNFPQIQNVQRKISDHWGLWVHTMHKLVPPEIYFETHPEYFALRNGIRVKDQLCLTNPEVLKITIESLKKEIAGNPKAKYWSVSQMDNFSYCLCDKCHAIDSIEGSPSGSIIRFVNEIAKNFPDKIISTLAYQYSRQVPKITKPLPNVNIMLCSIECDRAKPIEFYTGPGSFTYDLESWSKVSSNILVWDYLINFNHLVNPFPNFQVLPPNLKLFARNKVNMLFEQGYADMRGEFNELRCYMLAKLMWNPELDSDSLMNDFLNGYYGAAGPYIREYIDLQTSELIKSGKPLGTEPPVNHVNGFLSPANLNTYFKIFEKAMDAVKDSETKQFRVNVAMQSVRYAWLEVCKSVPFTDNWIFAKNDSGAYVLKDQASLLLNEFTNIAILSGLQLTHETKLSPQEYNDAMLQYFKIGYVNHLAINKPISYEFPPDPTYSATKGCLVDGVHGTSDYQVLWQGWYGKEAVITIDLEKSTPISSIKVTCMDDSQSWIFLPKAVKTEISVDGKIWTEVNNYQNSKAGEKIEKQNKTFVWLSNNKLDARYIKVSIANIGDLPSWRGEIGKAWLFIDEIEIY